MKLQEKLASFIQKKLLNDKSIKINADDNLINHGLIDSIGLIQIVSFIEEEAGIRISDENIIPDNFQTITAIDEMVQRLQSQ